MWVATIQVYPSGSTTVPQRSPQNISITGPLGAAPSFTALATVLSAFSVSRYKLVGEAPIVFALREPICGISGPNIKVVPRSVSSAWIAFFWPDNLNEYRHSDRRHCEPTTARSGVAPGRAVPSDRESRRFSPGHHFRELSQMR